jgi:hypothetical protein
MLIYMLILKTVIGYHATAYPTTHELAACLLSGFGGERYRCGARVYRPPGHCLLTR